MRIYLLFSAFVSGMGSSDSSSFKFLQRQASWFLKYAEAELHSYAGLETTISAIAEIVNDVVNTERPVYEQYLLARIFFDGPEDPRLRTPMDGYLHQRHSGKVGRNFGIDMLTIANVNVMEYTGLVRDDTLRENLSRFFRLVSKLGLSTREIEQLYAALPLADIPSLVERVGIMELSLSKYLENDDDTTVLKSMYNQFGIEVVRENPVVKECMEDLPNSRVSLKELLMETPVPNNWAVAWLIQGLAGRNGRKLDQSVGNKIHETLIEVLAWKLNDKVHEDSSIIQWRRKLVEKLLGKHKSTGVYVYVKLVNLLNYIVIFQRHGDFKDPFSHNNFVPKPLAAEEVNLEGVEAFIDLVESLIEKNTAGAGPYSLVSIADLIDFIQADRFHYTFSYHSGIINAAYETSRRFGLKVGTLLLSKPKWTETRNENIVTVIAAFIIFGNSEWSKRRVDSSLSIADDSKLEKAASFISYLVKSRHGRAYELDEAPLVEPGVWLGSFLYSGIKSSCFYSQFILDIYPSVVELNTANLPLQTQMVIHSFLEFPTKLLLLSKRASELFRHHWFTATTSLNRISLWRMFETALLLPSNLIRIICKSSLISSDESAIALLFKAAFLYIDLLSTVAEKGPQELPNNPLEYIRFRLDPLNHPLPVGSMQQAYEAAQSWIRVIKSSEA